MSGSRQALGSPGAEKAAKESAGHEDECEPPVYEARQGIISCGGEAERGHCNEGGTNGEEHWHSGRGDQPRNDQKSAADAEETGKQAGAHSVADELGGILAPE